MDEKLFEQLIESASQAAEIVRGERKPSRTFEVTSDIVREIRETTGLSQERTVRGEVSVTNVRLSSEMDHRADALAFVHEVECLVDVL